jgi:hypothetical protein
VALGQSWCWIGTVGETWWSWCRRLWVHAVTNMDTSETWSMTSLAGPCTPLYKVWSPHFELIFINLYTVFFIRWSTGVPQCSVCSVRFSVCRCSCVVCGHKCIHELEAYSVTCEAGEVISNSTWVVWFHSDSVLNSLPVRTLALQLLSTSSWAQPTTSVIYIECTMSRWWPGCIRKCE